MGKNKQAKDQAPNPNTVANREMFQRLSFLYQASAHLKRIEALEQPLPLDTGHSGRSTSRKKGGKRRRATLGELGSSYVRCMKTIGNKSVIRIDPNVKRTLCRGCDTVLLPGTTASVRVKGSIHKGQEVVYACLACHTRRNIPAPPLVSSPRLFPSSSSPNSLTPTSLQTMVEAPNAAAGSLLSSTQTPIDPFTKPKRKAARSLPLFARPDAGHVVFRGNEELRDE